MFHQGTLDLYLRNVEESITAVGRERQNGNNAVAMTDYLSTVVCDVETMLGLVDIKPTIRPTGKKPFRMMREALKKARRELNSDVPREEVIVSNLSQILLSANVVIRELQTNVMIELGQVI